MEDEKKPSDENKPTEKVENGNPNDISNEELCNFAKKELKEELKEARKDEKEYPKDSENYKNGGDLFKEEKVKERREKDRKNPKKKPKKGKKVLAIIVLLIIVAGFFTIQSFAPNSNGNSPSGQTEEIAKMKKEISSLKAESKKAEEVKPVKAEVKVESMELIQCTNPAGCIGKLDSRLPICPICQFPVPTYSAISPMDEGDIAQEIVKVLKEARSYDEEIIEVKAKKQKDLQERIANRKSYGLAHAQKVLRNAIEFRNAKARTLQHLRSGKKGVEGSLISGTYRGNPTWKKEEDFVLYPSDVR